MDLLPGYIQGITRVIISYPFDYVRTNIQAQNITAQQYLKSLSSYKILYSGVSIPLITVPIDRAISFKLYETLMQNKVSPYIAGGICGITSSFINQPFNYIVNNYITRKPYTVFTGLQAQCNATASNLFSDPPEVGLKLNVGGNNNIIHESKQKPLLTYIRNNIKMNDLFIGFRTELIKSTFASGIYLGVYGHIRREYGTEKWITVINATVSSIILWTIIYPLETIKILQQTKKEPSILKVLRTEKFNLLGLWRGISIMYVRNIPSSVMGMLIYEWAKTVI